MTIVATCAFVGGYDVDANVRKHLARIDEAAARDVDLLVFPECSLHGYPDQSARLDGDGIRHTRAGAEPVDGSPAVRRVIQHAAAAGMHVVFGLNEATDDPEIIYNTAVLTGPSGVIGTYRKVHLGHGERGTWSAGDQWPVFETALGRIGLLICADKVWPESTRELALGGAELMVMPTAWAFTIGGSDTIDACWAEYYLLFDRARAAENGRWFISANYAGLLGDTEFGGYSQIVDPFGAVVASSGPTPGMAIADIDIRGRIDACAAAWGGPGLVLDRRPHTYRRGRQVPRTGYPL